MQTPTPRTLAALAGGYCLALMSLSSSPAAEGITHQPYGTTQSGSPVEIYTLTNKAGSEARLLDYGGIVVSLKVPDKTGQLDDVVLGCDDLATYEKSSPYFGALIGRYGNRIARGKFSLDGHAFQLPVNDPPNSLHGGKTGFDKLVWKAKEITRPDGPSLVLTLTSPDGDQGYPGKLDVQATYTLTEDNALQIAFEATTDQPTVLNLTNHSYFDLRGQGKPGTILDHEVTIFASRYLPVDETSIPLGELRPVKGTAFDFTEPTRIGAHVQDQDPQLHLGPGGYDHCYALDAYDARRGASAPPSLAVRVHDPVSGRVLELWTSEPGVQFYSGNFLDGTFAGKGGRKYAKREAFCLEPQHYPDSPNHPEWPTVVLRPGETYHHTFLYKFSVQP